MAATIEQLTHDALTLAENDRAHLAQALLHSLEPVDDDVEQAWDVEIARRLARVQNGTAQGRPASEVFRDIRAHHQQ